MGLMDQIRKELEHSDSRYRWIKVLSYGLYGVGLVAVPLALFVPGDAKLTVLGTYLMALTAAQGADSWFLQGRRRSAVMSWVVSVALLILLIDRFLG